MHNRVTLLVPPTYARYGGTDPDAEIEEWRPSEDPRQLAGVVVRSEPIHDPADTLALSHAIAAGCAAWVDGQQVGFIAARGTEGNWGSYVAILEFVRQPDTLVSITYTLATPAEQAVAFQALRRVELK